MTVHTFKKWGIRIALGTGVITVLALVVFTVLGARLIDRIYGAHTQRVDAYRFEVERVPTAITNVSVLSSDGTEMLADRTVLLDEGKIVSITADPLIPVGTNIINGRGKFLIPGLIDSHVHLQRSPNDLLLYLANGVTQIQDMAGSKQDLALREEIKNGRLGPHLSVASPQLVQFEHLQGWYQQLTRSALNVHNPDKAEEIVRELAEEGYDVLKVYAFLDMDTHRRINQIAAEIGIRTVGHLPQAFPLEELATTQQQEIAHIEEFVHILMREFGPIARDGGVPFLSYVEDQSEAIADALIANDITLQTTLWIMESFTRQVFSLETELSQTKLEYANPGIVKGHRLAGVGWLPGQNRFEAASGLNSEQTERLQTFWETREEAHKILFRKMVERGVKFVAATDAPVELTVPGFSLHDELEMLNRNGMSAVQALQAATSVPAAVLNNNAGVIAPGKRADLVLLDANPLEDIRATMAIDTVIISGRILDRKKLDAVLKAVKQANAESRRFDIRQYE